MRAAFKMHFGGCGLLSSACREGRASAWHSARLSVQLLYSAGCRRQQQTAGLFTCSVHGRSSPRQAMLGLDLCSTDSSSRQHKRKLPLADSHQSAPRFMLEPTPIKKLRASPHSASSNNSCTFAANAMRCWGVSPSAVLPLPLPPGQRDQCLPLDVLLCHEDEEVAMLLGSPFEELSGGGRLQAREASEMGLSCSPCPGLESESSGLSDISIDPCECTQSTPSILPGEKLSSCGHLYVGPQGHEI